MKSEGKDDSLQVFENSTERRLLTIQAAAEYLSTTPWAIRSLLWGREVPFLRLGKRFLLDVRDLDAWIDRNKAVN